MCVDASPLAVAQLRLPGCIPCRDRLVLYSDRREMKNRIARRIKKDHAASAYPITAQPFLVTRDGIAPGPAVK